MNIVSHRPATRDRKRFAPGVKPPLADVLAWAEGQVASYLRDKSVLGPYHDDLCQEARIAAWQKWETFEPAAWVCFHSYAQSRVVGAIRDHVRTIRGLGMKGTKLVREGGKLNVQSLNAMVRRHPNEGPEPREEVVQLASDESDPSEGIAYQDLVEALARRLPPVHGQAWRLLFGHAAATRQKAAGRMIGVSESRVSQILSESCALLRERFVAEEAIR